MAGGYVNLPSDPFEELRRQLDDARRRISELERPTGSQIYDTLATLTDLVNNLATEIANVSSSGATWYGPVTTTGRVQADTGLRSAGVYSNLLSTSYRAVWVTSSNGDLGYVPSSRRFKQDEALAPDVAEALMGIQVVTYRYKQAVEELGDAAALEWGVIAEDLHALGLTWLVDYDEDGSPFGVRYDRLALALLPTVQDHEARIAALESATVRGV